jgi:hypothetical protein
MATRPGVEGIGAGNEVPCLGRPQKPGSAGATNTCAKPATHLLACAAYGRDEDNQPTVVDLVVGMCADHRPAIEFWAWRHWSQLGDGLIVPVEDRAELMRVLLNDPEANEVVSPLTGWSVGDSASAAG